MTFYCFSFSLQGLSTGHLYVSCKGGNTQRRGIIAPLIIRITVSWPTVRDRQEEKQLIQVQPARLRDNGCNTQTQIPATPTYTRLCTTITSIVLCQRVVGSITLSADATILISS